MRNQSFKMTKLLTAIIPILVVFILPSAAYAMAYPPSSADTYYGSIIEKSAASVPSEDLLRFKNVHFDKYSDAALVLYIQQLEQVAFSKNSAAAIVPWLDFRMAIVGKEIAKRLERQAGLRLIENNGVSAWDLVPIENQLFKSYRAKYTAADTCNLFRMTYAQAIIRMTILPASLAIRPPTPLNKVQQESPEFLGDREKALFELRSFVQIPFIKSLIEGSDCRDLLFPQKNLLQEAWIRYEFSQEGMTYQNEGRQITAVRWPIGRAIEMCGRPYNTHYMDPFFGVDSERPMVNMPGVDLRAYSDNLDAFARHLRIFDTRFLFGK